MLNKFITQDRDEIIRRCRSRVATRPALPSTPDETEDGVAFMRGLREILSSCQEGSQAKMGSRLRDVLRSFSRAPLDTQSRGASSPAAIGAFDAFALFPATAPCGTIVLTKGVSQS
jgi:hypothetical protein